LRTLPGAEFKRLLPHLEVVRLAQGKTLYEADALIRHAYFLLNGMVSLLATTEDGQTVEVAMIGNEGAVGISLILRVDQSPYKVMVQLPAYAMRIRADMLKREFSEAGQFQYLLLRYTHTLLAQISQSAACNRFHTVEQRLCRWLLVSRDRAKSDTLQLTQELLAHMLGSPRTSVTMIAVTLQKAGLIRYGRGKITIIDLAGLEATSCECYRIVRDKIGKSLIA
jgi:CRP-like cAMP-binding protein